MAYDKFVESCTEANQNCTLRGQLDFNYAEEPLELDEVEETANIVRRFCTGTDVARRKGIPCWNDSYRDAISVLKIADWLLFSTQPTDLDRQCTESR